MNKWPVADGVVGGNQSIVCCVAASAAAYLLIGNFYEAWENVIH